MQFDDDTIVDYYDNHVLSIEYLRDWKGKRPPIMICLPVAGPRILDQKWMNSDHGWVITGDPPNLTASPSIHIIGKYHGWLQNGELTNA